MKYLILFIVLFSSPLYAVDLVSSQYSCTHNDNDLVREVKITHTDPGCEVTYTKGVGTVNEKTDHYGEQKIRQNTAIIKAVHLLKKNFKKNSDGFVSIKSTIKDLI